MNENFIKQVYDYLFPKQNRVIAAVAFVRTFGQTLTGVFTVGAGGLILISVDNLQAIDWNTVGWSAAALFLSAILSGLKAFNDVSRNGLNSKYTESLAVNTEEIVAAIRPSSFVPAPVVAPVVEAPKAVTKKAPTKKAATKKADAEVMKVAQAPAVEEA